ncbi:MAG: VWA domain-containing protein, partial [Planctomycetes bacterium]|nr:VWA domain-containing protein [Planctomycetota bacterium]
MSASWPLFSLPFDAVGAALELTRPWGLLLFPLAALFYFWAARRRRSLEVASTFLWQQVSGAARTRRSIAMLLFFFLSALAAAMPRALSLPAPPPADPIFHVARALRPGDAARAEAIFAPGSGDVDIVLADARGLLAKGNLERLPDRPAAWSAPVSGVASGAPVTLHASGEMRRAYMPAPPRPLRVFDGSGSRSVRDALRALAASARTEPALAATADVAIVRAGGGLLPERAIVLPERGRGDGVPLPLPIPESRSHPLTAGLDAPRWLIAERLPPAAGSCAERGEPLLASDAGALITACGAHIHLAFDPDASDLPGRAAWPVLAGRLLEYFETMPEPSEPPPSWWRTEWPRAAILAAAAVALPFALGARRAFAALVLLALFAAAVSARRPAAGAYAYELPADAAASPRELLAAARALPRGGTLIVPASTVLPRERASFLRALRERGVRIEVAPPGGAAVALHVEPNRVEAGAEVALALESAAGAAGAIDLSLWAVAPDGVRTRVAGMDDGAAPLRARHRLPAAGLWRFEAIDADAGSSVRASAHAFVEEPIDCLLLSAARGGESEGSLAATESAAAGKAGIAALAGTGFRTRAWQPPSALAALLPANAARGIVLWGDLDPVRLSAADFVELHSWIERGGTLVASGGPVFFEDDAARARLSALLPAPLPPPPSAKERALGIVLLDLSGSLRQGAGFETLLAAVEALLERTAERGRWGVAYFRDVPGWIAAPGSRVDAELIREVAGADFGGGTDLAGALEFALAQFAAPSAGRALVLLTDGRQRASVDWRGVGARFAERGIELWAIGAGATVDAATLQALADGARGG